MGKEQKDDSVSEKTCDLEIGNYKLMIEPLITNLPCTVRRSII